MAKEIKILTIDTETYRGLIGGLKKIAIYDGQEVVYGNSFSEISYVIENYNRIGYDTHVYIHNLEFDLRKIPEFLEKGFINWKNSLLINGKVAKIDTQLCTLHDSFKLLPLSLKKLSESFEVENGKLDLVDEIIKRYKEYIVYKDNEIDRNATLVNFLDKCEIDNDLFLEYLGYDVISLYEVLERFRNLLKMDLKDFVKRVSTASISRFVFKNGFHGKNFKGEFSSKTDYEMLCSYKWQYDLETEEFIRMSYCGGRTEVFIPKLLKKGKHYDVNSLYPSQMKGEFPIGKPAMMYNSNKAKRTYEKWKKNREGLGFVNCAVFIPIQNIPPLPVKMGKLTFPCGYVFGTWTYEELEYAERECRVKIIEFYACCHFRQTYPVFERFIDTMYKIKEQATKDENEGLRTISKLLQNTGYGYTGMRRDDKTALDFVENAELHDKISFIDSELGFLEYPAQINADYIQVQVASYVTSRARLVWLKAAKHIEERGGNVYYGDTDSIVTDIELEKEFVSKTELGKWDLEKEPCKGLFLKAKVYVELLEGGESKVKFKGIGKDTQKDLNYNYYEKLYLALETGQKDYVVIEKNKLQLRSIMYMQKNHLDADYYETRDKKFNLKQKDKRIIDYTNNTSKPHFFNSLEEFENFNYNKGQREVQFTM